MLKKETENLQDKVVAVALHLAAARGWNALSLRDIAQEAGLSLPELHEHFSDRVDILYALGRMIDRKVLERMGEESTDSDMPPRDRLFDILMERFEVLNEHRDGIAVILRSFKYDPKQAVIGLPHLGRSMTWILEAAGLTTGGLRGAARVAGLSALYLRVVCVWMEDDSPDMAQTMAALDKALGRAEYWAGLFGI